MSKSARPKSSSYCTCCCSKNATPAIKSCHGFLAISVWQYLLRQCREELQATFLEEMADNPDNRTSRAQVFSRYGGKELHQLSQGEAFLALLKDGLFGNGLYIFDEPESALSPSRQLAAFIRIKQLATTESQFIIATHSPILMSYPDSIIYLLDEGLQTSGIRRGHFRVTRDFLLHYQRRLEQLLTDTPLLDAVEAEDDDDLA